jgi:hypothetical protein
VVAADCSYGAENNTEEPEARRTVLETDADISGAHIKDKRVGGNEPPVAKGSFRGKAACCLAAGMIDNNSSSA